MDRKSIIDQDSPGQSKPRTIKFTVTFDDSSWIKFWHMLIVGCSMSEQIMLRGVETHLAEVWNRLTESLEPALNDGEIVYVDEEDQTKAGG